MTIEPSRSSRCAWLMTTSVRAPRAAANKASTPVLSGNESIAPPQTTHGFAGRPQIYPELRQETQLAAPCPATFLRIGNSGFQRTALYAGPHPLRSIERQAPGGAGLATADPVRLPCSGSACASRPGTAIHRRDAEARARLVAARALVRPQRSPVLQRANRPVSMAAQKCDLPNHIAQAVVTTVRRGHARANRTNSPTRERRPRCQASGARGPQPPPKSLVRRG